MSAPASSAVFHYQPSAIAHTSARQAEASDPRASVWVAASAGTGKTKVLTDRILRLLLAGNAPQDILCLTYTKAAAAEMAGRLVRELTAWVTMPTAALCKKMAAMGVEEPERYEQRARQLFALVLDCPGGLKIQTLHSFCQSVLARFPLESGLAPNFTVLDEQLTKQLRDESFAAAVSQPSPAVAAALRALHVTVGEHNLREILADNSAVLSINRADIASAMGLDASVEEPSLLESMQTGADTVSLRALAAVWQGEAAKHARRAQVVYDFLAGDISLSREYTSVFLKTNGSIRTDYTNKTMAKAFPAITSVFNAEAERVLAITQAIQRVRVVNATHALATLRAAVDARYTQAKRRMSGVDYDDLIMLTERLLATAEQAAWVMYKLDHAIRHVLVDEGQDTNPAQWRILRMLTTEFTSSADALDNTGRTLFVVGDEKQTIYGFQGADPQAFQRERDAYRAAFTAAQLPFQQVDLTYSFRSVSAVLQVVDGVFATQHNAARANDAGVVELWPLEPAAPKTVADGWRLPTERMEDIPATMRLARRMADRIAGWLASGEVLPARGHPITAGDIMILLQRRGKEEKAFAQQIVRALKERDIPVAGVDRMHIASQLPVEDVLAAIRFALLPDDDVNLAALLKTPFIGVDEQTLFTICHARAGALWPAVQQHCAPDVVEWLRGLLAHHGARPYDFVQMLLRQPCPGSAASGLYASRARMGEDVVDPLHELLAAALAFEADHVPTLQGFLYAMAASDEEKKRELSQAAGAVRVMTVHAAKGLQAPIVFLADASAAVRIKHPRLQPDYDDVSAPVLYVPSADYVTPEIAARRTAYEQRAQAEYQRLLYVAMTRAEDRLIVCGIENAATRSEKNFVPEKNWYAAVQAHLQTVGAPQGDGWHYQVHNAVAPVGAPASAEKTNKTADMPLWAAMPAPAEPAPLRPLAPSRIADIAAPVASPVATDAQRFAAGTLTHKLLEVLPNVPPAQRTAIADRIMHDYKDDVDDARRVVVWSEVQAILAHPVFAPLFGPQSMAEVPVVGLVGTEAINGFIDRLLVTDTEVLVVDYKTNRPPPLDIANIPPAYLVQMACYRTVLQQVYPQHTVRCALLWTDGARLVELPAAMLDLALKNIDKTLK
jgi:ATP-dependent helicase/nuclease subunit A